MRKKLIKKLSAILLVIIIASIQLPTLQANALGVTNESKVNSRLTRWVLDEPTNTLYAIGENLLFINATTMRIEKSITFNSNPTDIIKDNGKLYVGLAYTNQIVIVDMASRTTTGTLYTSSDPYRIEKDGNKIYYTAREGQWNNIYEYDLITNKNKAISVGSVYEPDLAINLKDHILYIGESRNSKNMIYYSTTDNKVIGTTDHDPIYGFPYPGRHIIFDGTKIYYAGRGFQPDDPRRHDGVFSSTEDIIHVDKKLVYTNKSIYDKETYIKLGDYGMKPDLITSSNNSLYIYNIDSGIIKRFNNSNNQIDSSNVISLISGKHVPEIQNTTQSIQINSGMKTLEMKSKLIQWILDEPTNTIYGISEDDKALFFVNAQTLNLEKSLTFTSSPTDIIKDGDNLYIALANINQIAVVDINSRTITGRLYTSSDPYRIEKDGDKIYYTERDQHCNIYEYDLITNKDNVILEYQSYYEPDLAINLDDHILYIGESGSSGSNMIYYSTVDNRIIGKTNYNSGYGFPSPGRHTIFDGEKVYFAGFDFDKQNPTRILGSYDDDVMFAKYGLAFTKTSRYDSESYELIGYNGNDIDLYGTSTQGKLYYYSKLENSILRIDPSKVSFVKFDSQGGSLVKDIVVEDNALIEDPPTPIKAGYTFGGWYKESSCVNPWNFATDKVESDTILYAKWTVANIGVPTLVKAVSSSYNSINVSWGAVTGASGYELYRSTSSTGTYSLVTTTTATSYNNTALVTGTTCYYKVRAYRMVGTTKVYSSYSTIVSAKSIPPIPALVKAVSSSYNSIKVSWGAVTGASGYELYRSTSSTGTYSLVGRTTATSYNNTVLSTGTTYYYKVRSYRLVGTTKVYSNFTSVLSAKPVPSVPSSLKALRYSSTSINLTWNGVSGASGYEIYRATSSTGTYSLLKTTADKYYKNTGLTTGKTYYYKIRAYRTVGTTKVYSDWTTVVYAKP